MKKNQQHHPVSPGTAYRWRRLIPPLALALLVMGLLAGHSVQAQEWIPAGPAQQVPVVSVGAPVAPGSSPPVWSLPKAEPRQTRQQPRQPGRFVPRQVPEIAPPILPANSTTTPAPLLNFEGIADQGSVPPDTVGDVGPNHYIQMVNSAFAIFDKSGNLLTGPTNINALWPDSDTTKCKVNNDGDPIVLYDRMADRWMMTQFGVGDEVAPFYQCIAVSQTPDPTGPWYTYSFLVVDAGTEYNDYGKFGIWPDGYYMGANEAGFTAYVFDRVNMLAGGTARPLQKLNESFQNMMLPSDLDGATPPPAGTPNYFYTMRPESVIELWTFHVDWDTPANSSFTKLADLNSSGFIYDVCPANPTTDDSLDCIPQPGTAQALDAIGEWPMFKFQYRNHGTHESLVGNFTTDTDPAPGVDHAAPHWFELRRTGGNWTIQQEGTLAPDGDHRWLGSVAMDGDGNIAIGYNVSNGTNLFPSIRYATRLATDPPGTMGSEVTLQPGTTSQTFDSRWGDYSAMSVDPADDCTFWYTNQYIANDETWRTRIGAFKVPACGAAPAASISKTVSPTGVVGFGDVLTYTVVISTPSAQVRFYDPLQGTTFERFVVQPTGVIHSNGVVTGTLTVSPAQSSTVSFAVRVAVSGTLGAPATVTNRACFYPLGGSINDCTWSNQVTNPALGSFTVYMPLILRVR